MSSAITEANFGDARRGYNKKEVRAYLADLEAGFSEMEGHARESARRIGELEYLVAEMKAAEAKSMDNAMYAVFDAKDRILEKANRRAEKIENEAREKADELLADVKEMLDATRGSDADATDAVSAQAVLVAAHEEAAKIREEAARYAATVSDGDVETITEELAKARADAIAERARADKFEELARSQAVEIGDLGRDQGEISPDDYLAEARAQGTTIIGQAQTEAESILQRASDEARTVRDLARQETDRAAASAAIRELAYGSDPALELADARNRIVELELQLSSDSPGSDEDANADLLESEARIAVLEGELADIRGRLEATAAPQAELESLREAAASADALRDERDTTLVRLGDVEKDLATANGRLESTEDLEGRLAAADSAAATLRDELAEAQTTIESLQASVVDSDATGERIAELQQELEEMDDLKSELAKFEADATEAAAMVSQLETLEGELVTATAEIESTINELTAAREELEAVREKAERVPSLEAQIAANTVARERLIVVEGELAEATAAVEKLTGEIAETTERASGMSEKITEAELAETELKLLEEQIAERERNLENEMSQLSTMRDDIAQEKTTLADAWQRLDSEREIVGAGLSRVELANEDAAQLQDLVDERDQLKAELQSAIAELETERENAKEQLSALTEEREQRTLDAETIASKHDLLVVSSEEAESENAAIFARMERHQSDLQTTISQVRGERDELAQVNAALEAKVQQLQERTTELAQAAQRSGDDDSAALTETSGGDDDANEGEDASPSRPFSRGKSRYERNSAKLPRIGDEAGSVLKSMQDLRASLTEE